MSDTATPRYGYDPKVMFAATRACAERRARETAAAAASDGRRSRPAQYLIRSLATRLATSGRSDRSTRYPALVDQGGPGLTPIDADTHATEPVLAHVLLTDASAQADTDEHQTSGWSRQSRTR